MPKAVPPVPLKIRFPPEAFGAANHWLRRCGHHIQDAAVQLVRVPNQTGTRRGRRNAGKQNRNIRRWPLASVKVWSSRPVTSMCATVGSLPPKKMSELCEMEPLPVNVTSGVLPSIQ